MHWVLRIGVVALAWFGGVASQYTATSSPMIGRSTNYGTTDEFHSSYASGTCRCWGASSYRPNIPCFDSISSPQFIAAVDTRAMTYTSTCSVCLAVACINGVTRGLPYSQYPYPGCKPGNKSVIVTVTDTCSCGQNASNDRWCCQDKNRGIRHLDISTPAFKEIADEDAGVIDVLIQQIDCPDDSVTGVSWSSWESKYGQSIQDFSKSRSNVNEIATVEGACEASVEGASYTSQLADDASKVLRRTGELPIRGIFRDQNGLNLTDFVHN